jgi:hypothetical protein
MIADCYYQIGAALARFDGLTAESFIDTTFDSKGII